MWERVGAATWWVAILLSRTLNLALWYVRLPGGNRLGSGEFRKTLCWHWHHLSNNGVRWASWACRALDWCDGGHCKKASEREYD